MSGLSSAARDKIGAGAAHKKRAAEVAPSISGHGLSLSPPSNQQLACKGNYVLPILRCPLLADADIFN
jgi:hypothetical protein